MWADFTGNWATNPETHERYLTPNKRADEYLAELNAKREPGSPEFLMLPNEEAMVAIGQAQDAAYLSPWQHITELRYWEMLEVLPPRNYHESGGFTIFQMSEFTCGTITSHFASFDGLFFEGSFQTARPSYAEHEKAIRELARLFIGSYPAGIVYADRTRKKGGDYARAAFLPYDTLKLDIEDDCPADLAERIKEHAAGYKKGDAYKIATCGPEITLGSKAA